MLEDRGYIILDEQKNMTFEGFVEKYRYETPKLDGEKAGKYIISA